jgi:hypothetical protein
MSRTGIAPPPCDGAKRCPAHVRQFRAIRRRSESAGAPDLNTPKIPLRTHRSSTRGTPTRLLRKHRLDDTPFAVGQPISHDSRLRFGSWDHIAADAVKDLRIPESPAKRTRHRGRRSSRLDPSRHSAQAFAMSPALAGTNPARLRQGPISPEPMRSFG